MTWTFVAVVIFVVIPLALLVTKVFCTPIFAITWKNEKPVRIDEDVASEWRSHMTDDDERKHFARVAAPRLLHRQDLPHRANGDK